MSHVGLEEALMHIGRLKAKANPNQENYWGFLFREDGLVAFDHEKRRYTEVLANAGWGQDGDEEVRKLFVGVLPKPPAVGTCVTRPPWHNVDDATVTYDPSVTVSMVQLPIDEIRFAHDSQSEHFKSDDETEPDEQYQSVLQLVIELLLGVTSPEAVPAFSVCRHEGLWYCRSGNRRLAAFRLARRFAPKRFERISVELAPIDDAFLCGRGATRPTFTTHRNGHECNGQWLFIRETGEAIGRTWPGLNEYGADLLSLLPRLDDDFVGRNGA
jgi:hypothetical protein